MIFAISLTIAGCSGSKTVTGIDDIIATNDGIHAAGDNNLIDAVGQARESEKRVQLKIENISDKNETVIAKITLINPDEAQITSVRSFIAYNPDVLEGVEIKFPENTPFDLIAPGENAFDTFSGVAKIGVSSSVNPVQTKEIEIAQIKFNRKSKRFTTLDFYDSQDGGHTEVLGLFLDQTKNILTEPETPGLILKSLNAK